MPSFPACFRKIDPHKRMWRYYRLDIWPTLFGEWTLKREWGRIGQDGQVLTQTCESYEEAVQLAHRKAHEKERRGYQRCLD